MSAAFEHYDAIVIGGGFYGCALAHAFALNGERVAVLEKEPDLLTRASYVNQARVHNGYHYPRSYLTALRSAANFPRFAAEFRDCIDGSFEQVYAIAKSHSKVSANQFKRFCSLIKSPLRSPSARVRRLLNMDLIEEAFSVTEYAFDAFALRKSLRLRLEATDVTVLCCATAEKVAAAPGHSVRVYLKGSAVLEANRVVACAYSATNDLLRHSGLSPLPLKHELAEIALVGVPDTLSTVGITVMDGPFFSTMPFPARGVHSLTHVRYTPHRSWFDSDAQACHGQAGSIKSKFIYMLKDAQRYVPALRDAKYQESLFEVKSLLMQNEVDDGRPILFRKDYGVENFSIVIGSKIDNIYDALKALRAAGLQEGVEYAACT